MRSSAARRAASEVSLGQLPPSVLEGLGTAAAAFFASFVCGIAYSLTYRELGDSDVDVFLIYAAVFALFAGALFTRLKFVFRSQTPVRARILGALTGLLVAIAGSLALGAIAGPFALNVGIPLPLSWICGGLAAGYAASSRTEQSISANVAYLFAMLLIVGATWRETRTLPPRVVVYFRGPVDNSTRNEFFRTVIGSAAGASTEHALRPEILRAVVTRSVPATIVELQLQKHVRDSTQRSLVARLLAFPPVDRVVVTKARPH